MTNKLRFSTLAAGLFCLAALGVSTAGAAHRVKAQHGGAIFIHATGSEGPGGTIVIVGAIGDHGTTLQTNKAGKPDPNGNYVKISLQKGTFEVDSTALNATTAKLPPKILNNTTCSMLFTGTAPVKLYNGTGLYQGLKGTATITVSFGGISPFYTSGTHKGQCNTSHNAKPIAQWASITGPGAVTFGT